MKITVIGTKKEIEIAKGTIGTTCFLEHCETGLSCEDCEREQGLKIDYIVKESEKEVQE